MSGPILSPSLTPTHPHSGTVHTHKVGEFKCLLCHSHPGLLGPSYQANPREEEEENHRCHRQRGQERTAVPKTPGTAPSWTSSEVKMHLAGLQTEHWE